MAEFANRRVVDGLIYDTTAAEEIATHWNGVPHGDFHYENLGLYRTRKGAWFAAGETGALGRFARSTGDGSIGGKGVDRLTPGDAMALLQEWGESLLIERHFPDLIAEA